MPMKETNRRTETSKLIIINGNSIPADDLAKYMAGQAVINKYSHHAMTADEKLEGGE